MLSLSGSLESSESRRDPSPCLLACPHAAAARSANQSRAEIISAAGELDQSKRSVLKRPVRIQDVCAHAVLVADGDFFLCSGPLWYRAEPKDYAGPDSPRSEWKRPGGNPGGRRHSRTPRSRSPRVTRHAQAAWPPTFLSGQRDSNLSFLGSSPPYPSRQEKCLHR